MVARETLDVHVSLALRLKNVKLLDYLHWMFHAIAIATEILLVLLRETVIVITTGMDLRNTVVDHVIVQITASVIATIVTVVMVVIEGTMDMDVMIAVFVDLLHRMVVAIEDNISRVSHISPYRKCSGAVVLFDVVENDVIELLL